MKLTDDDFTSHACDDPSEESDGLGWNLDTDMTTEGKNELIRNQQYGEDIHSGKMQLVLTPTWKEMAQNSMKYLESIRSKK